MIIQLFDKGVVEYHFYSDEISNIRRGEAESDIILARLNKSDIRPPPRRITYLSDPHALNLITKISCRGLYSHLRMQTISVLTSLPLLAALSHFAQYQNLKMREKHD